jgi:acylphosphatase
MPARHILVSGIVQGVGFRWFTDRTARRIGVGGWVRNLADGRVEIYAEGDEEKLEALIAEVRKGPSSSRVDDVTVHEVDEHGLFDFDVTKSGLSPRDDL